MKPTPRKKLRRIRRMDMDALSNSELGLLFGAVALGLAVLCWMVLGWFIPDPKATLKIATGSSVGAYYQYAQEYKRLLLDHGIEAEVVETNGTVDNFMRLTSSDDPVDVAFIQAGPWSASATPLESLATVVEEPLWIFINPHSKPAVSLKQIADLRGLKLAIGKQGSGTYPVAQRVLDLAGIDLDNFKAYPLGGQAALDALKRGDVNAVFMVTSATAPIIAKAFDMNLEAMPIDAAQAFERHLSWAHALTLPQSVISLPKNQPRADIPMLSMKANLVARSDLHDSVKYLLLDVASKVHGGIGPMQKEKQFPSANGLILPQSEASKQFFKGGKPWLQKFLPFWSAYHVERVLIAALPVLVIMLPLLRAMMSFNERRNHAAIMRLLNQAKEIELQQLEGNQVDRQDRESIKRIETQLGKLSPLTIHCVDYFRLRESLLGLREALKRATSAEAAAKLEAALLQARIQEGHGPGTEDITPLTRITRKISNLR
jgi:TRAP transporter TAXI family solute receptor